MGKRDMLVFGIPVRREDQPEASRRRRGCAGESRASMATFRLWTCSWRGTLRSNRRTSVTQSARGRSRSSERLLDAVTNPALTFNGRTMTQVVPESPGRTRGGDLEALLQRYGARRTQSHTQNAAPAER